MPVPDTSPLAQPDAAQMAREALELAKRATPGTWKAISLGLKGGTEEARKYTQICGTHHQERVFTVGHDGGTYPSGDAAFIAHARTSLPALASAYLSAQSSLEAGKARIADLELMFRHALSVPDDEPWMANTPDGRCVLYIYDESDVDGIFAEEPRAIPLDRDAIGLPKLDAAARAALRESRP